MESIQTFFQSLDISAMSGFVLRLVSIFLCLTVHEACHGLAAYALGDPTAKQMHRLSLNPLRHIDWFGLAMMMVCGFGWAKAVPVDMRYFKNPKRGMALTALAGPVSNFLLAVVLLLCIRVAALVAPDSLATFSPILDFLASTAVLSIGLGVFNLLPIPPLDGSKVLGALLPDRSYDLLMRYERYGMCLLLLLSFTNFGGNVISGVISWVYRFLINLIF